jgi:Zn-dependent M28 family amino/carboxypeptidase
MIRPIFSITIAAMLLAGCTAADSNISAQSAAQIGEEAAVETQGILTPVALIERLSADDMRGRLGGDESGAKARKFLKEQLELRGLDVAQQSFAFRNAKGEQAQGSNIIIQIKGRKDGPALLVTAHYDHVGVVDGEIYNGASDNASGVAGAIAIAEYFMANPPENNVVIALLDAEEPGLFGAKALVEQGLPNGGDIAFNLNLDMIAGFGIDEIYASGSYHNPQLLPLLKTLMAKAPITIKLGHDRPEDGADDWTLLSDHGPFHQQGIAFIYLGVEDHKYYHQPGDTFDTLPKDFLNGALASVVMAAMVIDANLEAAKKPS